MTINFALSLEEQCEAIWEATRENAAKEKRLREIPPLVRLFDGDMKLQHIVTAEYGVTAEAVDGDTGPIEIRHPYDHPVGVWLRDMHGRMQRGEKRNVIVTIDYTGARLGGILADCVLELDSNGDQIVIATFASDYEQLKWYTVWSNPFLPAAVQFPRVFILPGPVPWVASTTLHLQLLRENLSLWALPDDPMNPSTWGSLDQSNWPIVVKPLSFMESMASGALWGIATSRWKNYHDAMKAMLRDAEVTPVVRRYLKDEDPLPWPGANLKNGALVVSFEDKSGSYTGTAKGGTIFDGLARTFESFAADFIDTTASLVTDTSIPAEYYQPGNRLTKKELPFAVWLDGEETGLTGYKHKQIYGKGVQILTGGHSMPGVVSPLPLIRVGAKRSDNSTKQSARGFRPSGTSSATSRKSVRSAAPSTPSLSRSTRTPSSPGSPSRALRVRRTQGGCGTSSTSRRVRGRRTPSVR